MQLEGRGIWPVHLCPIRQMIRLTAMSWISMPTGMHCIVVGACLKCGRHGLARSVTKAQSHDEGRVEEA